MIWFVVTEPVEKARLNAKFHSAKYELEACSGDVCLEINFSQVSFERFKSLKPWAIVHSGGPTPIKSHGILAEREYIECLREWPAPQLAICKSFQIAGMALGGAEVALMRPLREGEPDPDPSYHGGFFKELGSLAVSTVEDDPLFGRAGDVRLFSQSHAEELKSVPRGFKLLASSPECRVQAARRIASPLLYGVQFHPERCDESHPDGRRFLKAFFGLAKESGLK